MKLDVDIKEIKTTDLSKKLKDIVSDFSDEWNQWKFRQETYYLQRATVSFPLFWSADRDITENNILNIGKKNSNSIIWGLIKDDLSFLTKTYDGVIVKTILSNLIRLKCIDSHVDGGFLLPNCHRLHLPIITNENVHFIINNTTYNMKEGIWYEFDNTKHHSVANKSNFDRIHLMVDILPNFIINHFNLKINYI